MLTVLLGRAAVGRWQEGLVAESTAYGLLQAGPSSPGGGRPARAAGTDGVRSVPRCGSSGTATELIVTLDRPQVRNALDSAMRDGLVEALAVASHDPSVTVVAPAGGR